MCPVSHVLLPFPRLRQKMYAFELLRGSDMCMSLSEGLELVGGAQAIVPCIQPSWQRHRCWCRRLGQPAALAAEEDALDDEAEDLITVRTAHAEAQAPAAGADELSEHESDDDDGADAAPSSCCHVA